MNCHTYIRKDYLQTEAGLANHRKHGQTRRARVRKVFIEVVDHLEKYNEQNGICYLCGGFFAFEDTELDHVIPIALGGEHSKANTKTACAYCNRSKGAKLLQEVSYQMV